MRPDRFVAQAAAVSLCTDQVGDGHRQPCIDGLAYMMLARLLATSTSQYDSPRKANCKSLSDHDFDRCCQSADGYARTYGFPQADHKHEADGSLYAFIEQWQSYIASKKLPHSPIIVAIQAWLIVVEDPDGNRLRLYTVETHGADIKPDEDNPSLEN